MTRKTTNTPNPKMPGPRRRIGQTLQWMKAKKAAKDRAHEYTLPGEDEYRAGDARRGTGAVWQWAKAQLDAAEASRRRSVPGSLMYQRAPRGATMTAWQWDRSRDEAALRAQRRPIGFGRS